ncbi:MAG: hypothetical protein HOV94_41225 [Saccharothrix sp.]|nr:hypothetical protein [Saccharothrix sp.]
MSATTTEDGSYYDGKQSGARKALTDAAEHFESQDPDQTVTNAEVAQHLRNLADGR